MHLRTTPIVSDYFPRLVVIDPTGLDINKWRKEVKVFADVTAADPLTTHFDLERAEGQTLKVKFQYEKIQELCYFCGRLGHTMEICDWRRDAIEAGFSGIPDGTYRSILKAGNHDDSSSDEEN
ncbi:hypothetical protein LINPERHAP1_LOCUS35153 [Linum perenne]